MAVINPRRNSDEIERAGAEVFDRRVRPSLGPQDDGKFVAIDVQTSNFEINEDDYTAVTRLLARVPNADVWLMRVGQAAAYRMGRG